MEGGSAFPHYSIRWCGQRGHRAWEGPVHVVSPEARCSDVCHTKNCSLLCVQKGDIHHQHGGCSLTPEQRVTQHSGGKLACGEQWVTGWPLHPQPSTSSPALSSGSEEGSRWSEEKPRLLPGSASRIPDTQPSRYVFQGEKTQYRPTIQWASSPEWELSGSEQDLHIRDPDGVAVKDSPAVREAADRAQVAAWQGYKITETPQINCSHRQGGDKVKHSWMPENRNTGTLEFLLFKLISTNTVYSFFTMAVIFKLLYKKYSCLNTGKNAIITALPNVNMDQKDHSFYLVMIKTVQQIKCCPSSLYIRYLTLTTKFYPAIHFATSNTEIDRSVEIIIME